ncbi:MAG: alpha/beta fold hydrolase [Spirochaetaceae bacterium]
MRCCVMSLLLIVTTAALGLADGRLIEVTDTGVLSPQEIDRAIAPLFEGYDPPEARYPVQTFLIRFQSRYPDGSRAPITAQLFVPILPAEEQRPVYLFAPGTTGLLDVCRVSREHVAGINWGLYRSHVLSFAGQGVIGLLPDYTGFGDPDHLQYYYHAETEAMMILDAVRAIRFFFDRERFRVRPAPEAYLAGYSQGGHATFAAADLRRSYAPDVEIAGIIGYGPATDMEALFREFTVVAPMVVHTYQRIYGPHAIDPAQILAPRWAENLDYDVTRQCVGAMQSYYPWSAGDMFAEGFYDSLTAGTLSETHPVVFGILEENSPGLSGHGIPALILQGTEDVVVYPDSQEQFVSALRNRGSDVRYLVYEGHRHDTRQISFNEVLRWIGADYR